MLLLLNSHSQSWRSLILKIVWQSGFMDDRKPEDYHMSLRHVTNPNLEPGLKHLLLLKQVFVSIEL